LANPLKLPNWSLTSLLDYIGFRVYLLICIHQPNDGGLNI
jgi:hypothetical protein